MITAKLKKSYLRAQSKRLFLFFALVLCLFGLHSSSVAQPPEPESTPVVGAPIPSATPVDYEHVRPKPPGDEEEHHSEIGEIYEGTNEIQKWIIARGIFGKDITG